MLWIAGPLTRLARLSLASFERRGFEVALWSHRPEALGDVSHAIRDASEITPYTDDHVALSSMFRYRVLAERGGVWADMDVVALDGAKLPDAPAIASEKRRPFRHGEATATGASLTQVTNCFMAAGDPNSSNLWSSAADAVEALPFQSRSWEAIGPHLLTKLMLADRNHGVTILPPEIVDPVAWWNVPAYFLEARDPPPSPFMHMYQSIWTKRGVDPNAAFPPDSLAGRLWRANGL
ncbi:MAG: glycosyltransferase [Aestuariivirga sp.]